MKTMNKSKALTFKLKTLSNCKYVNSHQRQITLARQIVHLYKDVHDVKKLSPVILANIILRGFTLRKTVNNSTGEQLYYYRHGIFTPLIIFIRNLMDHIDPNLQIREFPDVLKHIQAEAKIVDQNANRNVVPCANGLYYRNNQGAYSNFQEYTETPQAFIRSKIATNYPNEHQLSKIKETKIKNIINSKDVNYTIANETVPSFIHNFFYKIANGDPDIEIQLKQEILDCLEPNYSHGKAVINYGTTGNNGKSNFTQLILAILGANNISALSMNRLNDKNAFSTLAGKMADISDDLGDDVYLKDDANFKSLITGGQVYVEQKYRNGYTDRFNVALIQNTNRLPIFQGKGGFIKRRLLIIPFLHHFTPDESNYLENDTMLQILRSKPVREWVLYEVLNQPHFSQYLKTSKSNKLLDQCMYQNDPIKIFYNELQDETNIERIPRKLLYKAWKQYANENNYRSKNMSNIKFYQHFETISNYCHKRASLNNNQITNVREGLDKLRIVYDEAGDLPKLDHSYHCYVMNQ